MLQAKRFFKLRQKASDYPFAGALFLTKPYHAAGVIFYPDISMKKSAVIVNLLRAVFIILAYKEFTHPKSSLIPPGTGRTTARYLKSCFQMGRSFLKGIVLKHRQQ